MAQLPTHHSHLAPLTLKIGDPKTPPSNYSQIVDFKVKLYIERFWEVVGGLSIFANPDLVTLPKTSKIGDLKTSHSNYGQTVPGGAKLYIAGRCEVMSELLIVCCFFPPANLTLTLYHSVHAVVANAPK